MPVGSFVMRRGSTAVSRDRVRVPHAAERISDYNALVPVSTVALLRTLPNGFLCARHRAPQRFNESLQLRQLTLEHYFARSPGRCVCRLFTHMN